MSKFERRVLARLDAIEQALAALLDYDEPEPEGVQPGTLTLPETAERLGIAKTTLYDLVRRGDQPFGTAKKPGPIPIHMMGNQRRTLVSEVERYLSPGIRPSALLPIPRV